MSCILKLFVIFTILLIVFNISKALPKIRNYKWEPEKPPIPKNVDNGKLPSTPENQFLSWNDTDETNIWEHSGLFEGDIVVYSDRNGIVDEDRYWPQGIVPFFIEQKDFNEAEIGIILKAMQELHNKTCIRFRPYETDDENWIHLKGDRSGCWSGVGMRSEGQVVNIKPPKCVRQGVVIHELLHALGLYHQQSATDRDKYIKILWENVKEGKEHNFKKYSKNKISSFGIEYDYSSIMHYGNKSFSRNGQPTIVPLMPNITIGQRVGMSEKDIIKVNKMYTDSCKTKNTDEFDIFLIELIDLFDNTLYEYIFG